MAVETGQWFDWDGALSYFTGSCLFSLAALAVFSSLVTERLTGVVDCSELARTSFPLDEDVAIMTCP